MVNMSSTVFVSISYVLIAVSAAFTSPVSVADCSTGQSTSTRGRFGGQRTARSADITMQYAVIIDAGSSGSRVRVYRWPDDSGGRELMSDVQRIKPTLKIRTGLAEIANDRDDVRDHIERLINNASGHIPPSRHNVTPIYFMATAGMRQLLEVKMNQIVSFVRSLMRDSTVNPFLHMSPRNSRILSGEEEGAFEWITVNYLLRSFANESLPTTGILEIGGVSTQIAFIPTGSVLADKFPVRIGRVMYSLYVHSYLGFGETAVKEKIKKALELENPGASQINNPCMLKGDDTQKGRNSQTFVGTGDPAACLRLLDKLIYKADPSRCHPKPCAIGAFYQPTIPPNMDFYTVGSGFYHTLSAVGALDEDGRYIPSVGFEKAFEYCQKPYTEALDDEHELSERKFVTNKCLLSLYIPLLLNTGFGFANDSEHIFVRSKIAGQTPEWTLGAVMYENVGYGCWISAAASTGRLHLVIFIFNLTILRLSSLRLSI